LLLYTSMLRLSRELRSLHRRSQKRVTVANREKASGQNNTQHIYYCYTPRCCVSPVNSVRYIVEVRKESLLRIGRRLLAKTTHSIYTTAIHLDAASLP